MNQFSADIAYSLEVLLVGAGFTLLYFALKEGSKLLKVGAYVMLIGGVLGLVCTTMFWFKYWSAGDFENPDSVTVRMIKHDNGDNYGYHFIKEDQ